MTSELQRFLEAQWPVYEQVCQERCAGRKQSHWMWYIFPQLAGLGHSPMSQHFAIANKEQAAAYLAHPVLGHRLRECAALVNDHTGTSAVQIFGYPDCLKLHSSLTPFREVSPQDEIFAQSLAQYYGGELDRATMQLLQGFTG